MGGSMAGMVLHEVNMNNFLSQLYPTGAEKVSSQNELSLAEISAADFLAAVDQGIINLDDYTGGEKVASNEMLGSVTQKSCISSNQ